MSDRIAIIGAGVSGLTAAYLLARRHRVVVYEAAAHAGGHAHTVEVQENGRAIALDTGFLVYNRRNYPQFCRLLDELGVATQRSDMSFSFRDERTGFEYAAPEPWRLFAQPRNLLRPAFWGLLREILRFYREAPRLLAAAAADAGLTLEEYLARSGYSEMFVQQHLLPFAAAIWSAGRREMGAFPARAFVAFFQNHGLLSLHGRPRWRTVSGGSRRYVERLTAPLGDRLRLSSPVISVRRDDEGVLVTTSGGAPERFSHVVVACHADQALALLTDASDLERETLGAFVYAANDVVLHSDLRLLPRRRAAWSSWNAHGLQSAPDRVAVTYHLNLLQRPRCRRRYLITLNRTADLDPATIHGRFTYDHPQYDRRALAMQNRHEQLNGQRRTYFCGAYWGYGFHEDGVASALRVAARFGETL